MTVSAERLLYRPVQVADISDLFAFLGDKAAMRFTHHDQTMDACQTRLLAFEARRETDGFAPWVVRWRKDHRVIGWGGLYIDPFDPDWGPEIGYFFHPDVWGQGCATELARTAIDYACKKTMLEALTAFAHPHNTASSRLLRRLGFGYVDFVEHMNRDRFCLAIQR